MKLILKDFLCTKSDVDGNHRRSTTTGKRDLTNNKVISVSSFSSCVCCLFIFTNLSSPTGCCGKLICM